MWYKFSNLSEDQLNTFLAKFGVGPKYKPKKPKTYPCPKCKNTNAKIKEMHEDTDLNCMELICPDCKYTEEI